MDVRADSGSLAATDWADGDTWVFGYGSLMWRPGFTYRDAQPALLRGYHRTFCVYSVRYRGTPERPGLVVGLDRGGSCWGRAYRVAAEDWTEVCAYLDGREMTTGVYRRQLVPVALPDRRVAAHAYIVNRCHRRYAPKLSLDEAADLIAAGRGAEGDNVVYLQNTVAFMDELGIRDGPMHSLLHLVRQRRTG